MRKIMLIEEHLRPEAECLNHRCSLAGSCEHYLYGEFDPETAFSPRGTSGETCGYYLPATQ